MSLAGIGTYHGPSPRKPGERSFFVQLSTDRTKFRFLAPTRVKKSGLASELWSQHWGGEVDEGNSGAHRLASRTAAQPRASGSQRDSSPHSQVEHHQGSVWPSHAQEQMLIYSLLTSAHAHTCAHTFTHTHTFICINIPTNHHVYTHHNTHLYKHLNTPHTH